MSDRLLTARELGERLGVSTETILRWVRRGQLSAIRLPSGAIRFRVEEIERWMDEHATADGADPEAPATGRTARRAISFPTASHQQHPTQED